MAASRKLQAEIDRCLKKVSEGVELFEDIWLKVHNATNPNQKEKYESDLKKEIKKLQRLRDQIKTWIASGEIKDKSTLIDTRKLIETQMERFKVVERETKTKAYSKEGLVLVMKADPMTRERDELNMWLINTIDQMQMQVDGFESDIETLLVSKKKKLDKEKQEKLDLLKRVCEKHKYHAGKLEVILRTLDNIANEDSLPIFLTQVRKIKEDIDYYMDSAQDPEYEDNEFLYDDIDSFDEIAAGISSSTISPTHTPTMDSNPNTPTASTGRLTPSLQALVDSQAVYLQQQQILEQKEKEEKKNALQQVQVEQTQVERRKSCTEETANSKIFKPLPVKLASAMSGSVGGVTSKAQTPVPTTNNNVSTVVQSLEVGDTSHNEPVPPVSLRKWGQDKFSSDSPSNMESDPSSGQNNLISFSSELERKAGKPQESSYKRSHSVGPTPPPYPPKVSVPQSEPVQNVPFSSNGLNSYSHQQQLTSHPTTRELYNSSPQLPSVQKQQEGLSSFARQWAQQSEQQQAALQNQLQQQQQQQAMLRNQQQQQSLLQNQQQMHQNQSQSVNNAYMRVLTPPAQHQQVLHQNQQQSLIQNQQQALHQNQSQSVNNAYMRVHTPPAQQQQAMQQQGLLQNQQQQIMHHQNQSQVENNASHMRALTPPTQQQPLMMHQNQTQSQQENNASHMRVLTPPAQHQQNQQQPLHQSQQQIMHPNQSQTVNNTHMRAQAPAQQHDQNQIVMNDYIGDINSTPVDIQLATLKMMAQEVMTRAGLNMGDRSGSGTEETTSAHIPPLLGVAPLGPVPLTALHEYQLSMLEAAHFHLPIYADSEPMRQYLPRNPVPTPSYYPQSPVTNSEDFFSRLSIETLFFIFYYLEGTRAQYMAAKVLKKQSWRFHTKFMMWFQRHEEPKVINEVYEQGTYIYFDIEKWGQRKKDGFVFEYQYLEDRELN